MKIMFLTTSFPRFAKDHAGSFVYRFAKYLSEAAQNILVVAPGDESAPRVDQFGQVQVVRAQYFFPASAQKLCYGGGILSNMRHSRLAVMQVPFLFLALSFKTARHIRGVDIVHCHWLPTVWAAKLGMLLCLAHKPIVFTNWGSDTRGLPALLTRVTLRLCAAVVSTAAETDMHLRRAGFNNFSSIMAPVDEERFLIPADSTEEIRRELGLPLETPILSFVCRLDSFKDPLTFIEACGLLAERKVKFVALLAGDGDLAEECLKKIRERELQNTCIPLGMRSDPERILAVSTATVHISPIENTWANTIAEAMFSKCPVVLTRAGCTETTFTHNENCLLIPPGGAKELADAFQMLIEDPPLRKQLVIGAERLLKEKGKSKAVIVEKMIEVYASVLK